MSGNAYFTINNHNLELFFNPSGIDYIGIVKINEDTETLDFILKMDKVNSELYYAWRNRDVKECENYAKLLRKLKSNAENGLIARYMLTWEQFKLTGNKETRTKGVLKGIRNAIQDKGFNIKDGFPLTLPNTRNGLFPYNKRLGCYLIPIKKIIIQKNINAYGTQESIDDYVK